MLVLLRPIIQHYLKKNEVLTNADRLIGKYAICLKKITPDERGEVKIDGKIWSAISNETVEVDEKVEVLAIEGVKLVVRKVSMNAGFLKRAVSSLIDLVLVFAVVALAFIAGRPQTPAKPSGSLRRHQRRLQRNLRAARDADTGRHLYRLRSRRRTRRRATRTLKTEALERLRRRPGDHRRRNTPPTSPPIDAALTGYYMTCIYFFSIGFLIVMGIYTLATRSADPRTAPDADQTDRAGQS
ncbi:MAG: NfeD family protein [Sphingobacterium sp.]|nr:NfeD family protein [Sphingobacterium sp.]